MSIISNQLPHKNSLHLHSYLIGTLIIAGCAHYTPDHLKKAEALTEQREFEAAKQEYRLHMEERLTEPTRPADENPYFYLLALGDLQLKQEDPKGALKLYEEAEQKGVENTLISDRFRSVALWYEARGETESALAVLKQYRNRDDLLFDAMLDRLARELTAKEEQHKKK